MHGTPKIKYLIPLSTLLISISCFAETSQSLQEFMKKFTIDGYLRSYYFTRDYSNSEKTDQSAFSLGGGLNVKTVPIHDISAGVSYYAADPLGLNSDDITKVDLTLPGKTVNVFGQSYLQYQNHFWLLRGGNQIIKTPWLNDSDSRMIPATYQAILATYTPIQDLDLTAFRQFRFKSRTSKHFNETNLYDPDNFGGSPIKDIDHESVPGTLAGGIHYKLANLTTQAWYYKFYDFADLAYVDASYIFKNDTPIAPKIGIQLAREGGDGENLLEEAGQGKTNSTIIGALLGLDIYDGQIAFGYDTISKKSDAFQDGDVVSPYTTGYATDPLYTTSMIAGLVEKAAGYAGKISGNYTFLDKQFRIAVSYAKYYTDPTVPNTSEVDGDVTYTFKKTMFKGLSLRNRIGILNGNPSFGRFVYNRIMIQYDFK